MGTAKAIAMALVLFRNWRRELMLLPGVSPHRRSMACAARRINETLICGIFTSVAEAVVIKTRNEYGEEPLQTPSSVEFVRDLSPAAGQRPGDDHAASV